MLNNRTNRRITGSIPKEVEFLLIAIQSMQKCKFSWKIRLKCVTTRSKCDPLVWEDFNRKVCGIKLTSKLRRKRQPKANEFHIKRKKNLAVIANLLRNLISFRRSFFEFRFTFLRFFRHLPTAASSDP